MNLKKKDMLLLSELLMGGSFVAILLAGIGYMGIDIWLASTQWLIISCVLALFGIYFKVFKS